MVLQIFMYVRELLRGAGARAGAGRWGPGRRGRGRGRGRARFRVVSSKGSPYFDDVYANMTIQFK